MPINNSIFNRVSVQKKESAASPPTQARRTVCVIRELTAGQRQYVPVSQVLNFEPGEILYTGFFQVVRQGKGHAFFPVGPVYQSSFR